MAIGERIRYFRSKRGMTQKQLGILAGFPEKSADVRLAQYEAGTRTPKAELTATLANLLEVTTTQVSDMERGNTTTSMARLYQLCEYFNVSADYLLGFTDDPKPKGWKK